jgi:hypothetical protein
VKLLKTQHATWKEGDQHIDTGTEAE